MKDELTKAEKLERLGKLIDEYEGCLPNRFYMEMGYLPQDKVAVRISHHDFSCTFHIHLDSDWDTIVGETKKRVIQECGLLAQCHTQKFINDRIWDLEDNKSKDK